MMVTITDHCLLVVFIHLTFLTTAHCVRQFNEDHYTKCTGRKADSDDSYAFRSSMECIKLCSRLPSCTGVNVCPSATLGQVLCGLSYSLQSQPCGNLTRAASTECYFAFKTYNGVETTTEVEETSTAQTQTTTELVCEKGGTKNGNRCEYAADCQELNERNPSLSGFIAYYIQPATSTTPFDAWCKFSNGGYTVLIRRWGGDTFPQDWDSCLAPINTPSARNNHFFVGLHNLHLFLSQATYDLQIWMAFYSISGKGANYLNFTVGPESTSFEVNYNAFDDAAASADNGYSTSFPIKFSTNDRDVSGCSAGGTTGWFGADCLGSALFSDTFYWPVNGQQQQVKQMDFIFQRKSPIQGN